MSSSSQPSQDAATTPPDGRRGTVWVVTIGDELLAGDITDTNLAFLARCCREAGMTVLRAVSVRDRVHEIVEVLGEAKAHGVGACLVSGGLGPTTDDLTTVAIAEAGGVPMSQDEGSVSRLREKFRAFGIEEMPISNLKQAEFPKGAEILPNPIGSAEGFMLRMGGCCVFSMPGVPRELTRMTREQVMPRLVAEWSLSAVPRRIYRVSGVGESSVAQRLESVLQDASHRSAGLANMFVHYRASMPNVSIILEGVDGVDGVAATSTELAQLDAPIIEALGTSVYGIGEAEIGARVIAALQRADKSFAVAESCTGGGIGALLSAVPGASSVFLGGIIAYRNAVKMKHLRVPEGMLAEHGAVSEPVARAMAQGGCTAMGADLCVGITGIAGPDGGTVEKPIGTVHVAVADAHGQTHAKLQLRGDRATVQRTAAQCALKLVWDHLVARSLATVAPMD